MYGICGRLLRGSGPEGAIPIAVDKEHLGLKTLFPPFRAIEDQLFRFPRADPYSHGAVHVMSDHSYAEIMGQAPRASFWTTYLRIGFIVLAIEAAAAFAYFLTVSPGRFTPELLTLCAGTVLVSIAIMPLTKWIGGRTWRSRFSFLAAIVSGIALTSACAMDGGIDSPLVFLAVLPILNAALALEVPQVIACGAAGALELVFLTVTDSAISSSDSKLIVFFALVAGSTTLAVVYSSARRQLESVEASDRAELARLAETDSLTGCLNHRAFYGRLAAEIDRITRYGSTLSLMVLDIDLFKDFNDSHGHQAGDEALRAVGSLIRGTARRSDIIGRIGGDEFAIILPATSIELAQATADRLVRWVRESPIGVSVSIGVAEVDESDQTVKRLFGDADAALYKAKALGRGRTSIASAVHSTSATEIVPISSTLRQEDFDLLANEARRTKRDWVQSVARMESMLNVAPFGICFVDLDFRIQLINSVFAKFNDAKSSDQVGKTVEQLVPDLWPQLEPAYQRVLRTGQPLVLGPAVSDTASTPGMTRYWLTSVFPVRANGRITGLGVLGVDVTDRQALAESEASLVTHMAAALAATVEERDPYTAGHEERVARIATAMATALGWDEGRISELTMAARVHDLGKIRIPAEILSRPGRLDEAEMALVRRHAQTGYDILHSAGFPEGLCQIVLQHHERLDGSGYPQKLTGDQICPSALILAVADVAEAMTAPRPYRASLPASAAISELQKGRGQVYDAAAVDAYVRLFVEDAPNKRASGPLAG